MNKHKKIKPTRLEVISKNGVVIGSTKPIKEGSDSDVLKQGKENKVAVSEKMIFAWINPYE